MKFWNLFLSTFFFWSVFVACSKQPPLSGTIEGFSENTPWARTIYLIQPQHLNEVGASFAGTVIDSATIQTDGRFVFPEMPEAEQPVLFQLVIQKRGERFVNRLENDDPATSNYFPFVWKNSPLYLHSTADGFQKNMTIKSTDSEQIAMMMLRDHRLQAFEAYQQQMQIAQQAGDTHLLEEADALLEYQRKLMEFATTTKHLLPALTAIRWISPENDFERIPEFLYAQCERWKTTHPEHPWVEALCAKSKKLPILQGTPIPDMLLPLHTGDTLSLHQLLGKKLTIIDLWASWCAPCRHENRVVLTPLWEKYHTKGLQIVAYALDGSDKVWKNAIEKDGAYRWLHSSHLQGDDAPLLERLRIQTIPANLVVDAKGIVMAKNLHGETLEAFVTAYFSE